MQKVKRVCILAFLPLIALGQAVPERKPIEDVVSLTPESIGAMSKAVHSSQDREFGIFYRHRYQIDKLMSNEGKPFGSFSYVEAIIDGVATREHVMPVLNRAKQEAREPDWMALHNVLAEKYSDVDALRLVTRAKMLWYRSAGDTAGWCGSIATFIRNFGVQTANASRNNATWAVFQVCTERSQLQAAADWIEALVWREVRDQPSTNASFADTYANILYKLGRTQEAIRWEERAIQITPKDWKTDWADTVAKMKRGAPTWVETHDDRVKELHAAGGLGIDAS